MKKASLVLNPQQVQVSGPPELVTWIEALREARLAPEATARAYTNHMKEWFVTCAITGEPIIVTDLKYWNVEKNEVYKSAEVVPLDRYPEAIDKPEEKPTQSKSNNKRRNRKKHKR
jgi:hypothetical protein